jgi:O-antigen/teichoic acid export membrane protein
VASGPDIADRAPSGGDYAGLSFRQLLSRFFGYSFSYGALNLLTKLGGFLLFPILWRFLTPADYGIIGMAAVIQGLAGALMTLGLESGLGRFYHEWTDAERPRKIGVLWLMSAGFGLALALVLDFAGARFSGMLIRQVDFHPYLRIALWSAYLGSLSVFPFIILRISERIRFFGVVSFLTFLTNAALTLYFVAALRMGPFGFLLAALLVSAGWGLFWCAWMWPRVRLALDPGLVRQEIRYSLPAIPINIAGQLDGALDRLFIDKVASLSQIGLYSLGKKLGEYFNMLNQSLKTAWMPMIFKMIVQRADFREVLPRLSMVYLFALGVGALSLTLLSEELISLFGGERYAGMYPFVPWFVAAFFAKNFATAWGRGMDIAKRPQLELIPVFAGSLSNVALLALLVPTHGMRGAMAAFLASSIIGSAIQVWLAHRAYPREFPIGRIALFLASLGAASWLGSLCDFGNLALSALGKAAIITAWTVAAGLLLRSSVRLVRSARSAAGRGA